MLDINDGAFVLTLLSTKVLMHSSRQEATKWDLYPPNIIDKRRLIFYFKNE